MPPSEPRERPTRSRLSRGQAFALAWATFAVFYTLQSYTFNLSVGRTQTWGRFVGLELVFIGSLAALTPIVLALGKRLPLVGTGQWSRFGRHLAAAIVLAFAQRFVFEAIQRTVRATPENPFSWTRSFQASLGAFETGVFVYFLVLLAMHFWDYYERYGEEKVRAAHLRADLSAAQLESLRTQVQPHFLFNTLNTVSVLIEEDPAVARRMIGHLGDFLRATLAEEGRQEISLRRELELLDHYLRIEQTRFGDRLHLGVRVAPAALDSTVPALLLQPLVENAIRHGFSRRPGPGRVEIEADLRGETLVLAVRDFQPDGVRAPGVASLSDGPAPSHGPALASGGSAPAAPAPACATGFGIGLRNTEARLRELYGEFQSLSLRPIVDGGREVGTEVTVSIERGART